MNRALDAEMKGHLDALRDLVTEAEGYHREAIDAADRGNKAALASAHLRVSRCFRSLHVRFARIAGNAMQADSDNVKETQNSGGMGEGTSGSPRAMHPLMTGDIEGWVGRAFGRKK
jgi:hypothetical protein